ncbi:MAG: hypothetical protein QM817_21355 [Archangium sp.]
MRTPILVVSAVVLSLTGCKKAPSPAQVALDGYIVAAAKARIPPEGLASGASLAGTTNGGEPVDGTVEQAHENVGTFSWARTKPVSETKLPNGDLRVEMIADVCMRAEGESADCTRPNTYSYTAIMRNEDGSWKIAGSAVKLVNSVR